MITTTGSTITVTKTFSPALLVAKTAANLHLEVKKPDGSISLVHNPASTTTAITFSSLAIDIGINTITIYESSNADLDTSVTLTKLGSGSVRRITSESTLIIN